MTMNDGRAAGPQVGGRGAKQVALTLGVLLLAGCSASGGAAPAAAPSSMAAAVAAADAAPAPSTTDPRVGLRAGRHDAGEASWNMRLISNMPSPPEFAEANNSDLAFLGQYVIQGNYNGFMVWDVEDPSDPFLTRGFVCPASQSDVSVFQNLLFVSSESTSGRLDCGTEAPQEAVSHERLRGVRIFDITDIGNPVYIANVQTCRGSHTHTVVTDPNDAANIYIYVSGSAAVRPAEELDGCSALAPDLDPNSSLFRIEVIRVPLAAPQDAHIVTSPRIFRGLDEAPRRTEPARAARPERAGGPNQCHDITTYPAVGLAGGACQGYGILLDIRNPAEPQRLYAVADTNFATWHSVTFSNDGSKVIFTDEWGGGSAPRCRATDSMIWGANAIFEIVDGRMEFRSYYKMPAAQTETENCVAHNGSLVPIPGRDIKVQGWYQGGVSMFDWTDARNPIEIAYFDRGPLVADTLRSAGSWSTYWYNGYVYTSEMARGLDVLELEPSEFITQNELEAARTVRQTYFNAQEQQQFTWAPTFVLAQAYVDQLERSRGLSGARINAIRAELARTESLSGAGQRTALTSLAGQLDRDAGGSGDAGKVRLLAEVVRDLAAGA